MCVSSSEANGLLHMNISVRNTTYCHDDVNAGDSLQGGREALSPYWRSRPLEVTMHQESPEHNRGAAPPSHIISHIIFSSSPLVYIFAHHLPSWFQAVFRPRGAAWRVGPPKAEALSTPWCLPFLSACFHKDSRRPRLFGVGETAAGGRLQCHLCTSLWDGSEGVKRHVSIEILHLPHAAFTSVIFLYFRDLDRSVKIIVISFLGAGSKHCVKVTGRPQEKLVLPFLAPQFKLTY